MSLRVYAGLAGIADRYDGFILDLWGVVHDGRRPYPGAVTCMRRLRGEGRRVLLLSNAPRLAVQVAGFLDAMGVPGDAYDRLITSGELTRAALAGGSPAGNGGRRFLHVGPPRDLGLLDGLGYQGVEGVEEADFLLCSGLHDDERETAADYATLLAAGVDEGLPLVCVNPDLTVMRGDLTIPCAGLLALDYERRGGRVHYYGKPHAGAYRACFDWLGLDPARVVAIGDSLRTDIAGANRAGIASLLVPGGIHAAEWGVRPGEPPDPVRIAAACKAAGVTPDGLLPELRW